MAEGTVHALGYVRVCNHRQIDGYMSLTDQIEALSAHYRHCGVELVTIYTDEGFSGATDNRPGLQALFAHALRSDNGISEIGVCSFSRLFRDRTLLDHYRCQLRRADVRLIAVA